MLTFNSLPSFQMIKECFLHHIRYLIALDKTSAFKQGNQIVLNERIRQGKLYSKLTFRLGPMMTTGRMEGTTS